MHTYRTQAALYINIVCVMYLYACAVRAGATAASSPEGARTLGRASILMSVLGVITTVTIILIVQLGAAPDNVSCPYEYLGTCYQHCEYVGPDGDCYGELSTDGYCYYD